HLLLSQWLPPSLLAARRRRAIRTPAGRTAKGPRSMPIRPRTVALLSVVVLLTGCAAPTLSFTTGTTSRDDPALPPPTITEPLPRPWEEEEMLWTAPFSSEPKAAGSSFVGISQDREGGDVHFLGVDREGRTQWSAKRDPECTAFAVTHSTVEDKELVVL